MQSRCTCNTCKCILSIILVKLLVSKFNFYPSAKISGYITNSEYYNVFVTYKKGKGSPYWITERRVPQLIPVLASQPAGEVSHKPGGSLPLLSAGPAVTPATLKRAATNFAAW